CHAALNTAKLVKMSDDPLLRRDVEGADLITADGMGIVLAGRLLGARLPERVTGIDLMDRTLGLCARKGFRPFLLGARPEVLRTAAYRLQIKHPGLRIAGMHHGYFAEEDEAALVDKINSSRADCLFVALPSPMKERFIARHRGFLNPAFIMGVGGSLDVFAGHVTRAPLWMQNWGLEWLHRTLAEPRRMWRRYLTTNTVFLGLLAQAMVDRALGRPVAGPDDRTG
ncbi:MAG: WecB/TagA/CpsF family glycosyltransferase, partial [Pseudomonadota bacterium]